jgi:PIN domain nuclease of toxin-antitoxin system
VILLDSQTLVWYLTADIKLGKQAKARLIECQDLYFSSLSILELEIKQFDRTKGQGRLIRSAAIKAGLRELEFGGAEAETVSDFPLLGRHDPIDRGLIQQAAQYGAVFFTSNKKLLNQGLAWVIDSQE